MFPRCWLVDDSADVSVDVYVGGTNLTRVPIFVPSVACGTNIETCPDFCTVRCVRYKY